MTGNNRFISLVGCCLSTTVLLVALATGAAAQKHDKDKDHGGGRTSRGFLTAPLHIQDQGSFYIGGVRKPLDVRPPPWYLSLSANLSRS